MTTRMTNEDLLHLCTRYVVTSVATSGRGADRFTFACQDCNDRVGVTVVHGNPHSPQANNEKATKEAAAIFEIRNQAKRKELKRLRTRAKAQLSTLRQELEDELQSPSE